MESKEHKAAVKPKVVAVVGPNASGKSDLAVELAHKFNGEIVSADSRQIYRSLDLSSGKVPGRWKIRGFKRFYEYQGIPHHLIDAVSPRKRFSAQQYRRKAQRAIKTILEKDKLPIVAGGTGLYINILLHDIPIPEAPPNNKLRRELDSLTTDQLMHRLKALDPERAKVMDPHNRRRIIRAIEVVVSIHSTVPKIDLFDDTNSPYDLFKIGVELSASELKRRIKLRLERRLKEGMVEEIKRAHLLGISWRRLGELGIEFRAIAKFLKGEIGYEQMQKDITSQSWQYARRQMTWFKRDQNIIWLDVPAKAAPLVRDFLSHEV
ncbi:MAG: tRNA (adenosine(37)-N6)-dimethylallyltransferase MiaA [bacterium]|nr:tRNA (adenosine(37)-N6)-dimethylallyltransferase MiaA [bacterium]MDZ4231619.1 tRNA (adenosine(37)-N6)-dimethylallyltransferase MiaA [Patescibacteria group bacterium]